MQETDRLDQIEVRLSALEAAIGSWGQASTPPRPVSTPKTASVVVPKVSQVSPSVLPVQQFNWLGLIAVICFVLAAGFIIKLSISSGWLTPSRQIGLAALFGGALIGLGLYLKGGDLEYASLLPGAGIIILYLTAFSAHSYYMLVPFSVALAMMIAISALCVWLFFALKKDLYVIVAALGAYTAPILLQLGVENNFSLYYFLVCSVAFAGLSIWAQSRVLAIVSAYAAIFLNGMIGLALHDNTLVAYLSAIHFLIFVVATSVYSLHHRKALSRDEAMAFLPLLLLFYAQEYYFINLVSAYWAPWISLGFAGLVLLLYVETKKHFSVHLYSQDLVVIFTTVVCFHSIYLVLLPEDIRPSLFALILLGAAFVPLDQIRKKENSLAAPTLAALIIFAIEFFTIICHVWNDAGFRWQAYGWAGFAALWLVIHRQRAQIASYDVAGYVLLGAAHILALLGFYRLTEGTGSIAVSATWLLYGTGVMLFAFARKDRDMLNSSLCVLVFAAGKALLYDASAAPTGVRIFCLILTGAVLYGCGLLLRRFAKLVDATHPA